LYVRLTCMNSASTAAPFFKHRSHQLARYVLACTCMHTRTHAHSGSHTHARTHTLSHTHTLTHTRTHTHAQAHTHARTHTHAHTHTHTHAHSHTHAHTHTQYMQVIFSTVTADNRPSLEDSDVAGNPGTTLPQVAVCAMHVCLC